MVKIAWHPLYAHPLPEGHRFPMLKYELIPEQLLHEGVITEKNLFAPDPLGEDIVLLSHQKEYWNELKQLTLPAKEQRRIGFSLNAQLLERELRIAKGTIDGTLFALERGIAFNVAGGYTSCREQLGRGLLLIK